MHIYNYGQQRWGSAADAWPCSRGEVTQDFTYCCACVWRVRSNVNFNTRRCCAYAKSNSVAVTTTAAPPNTSAVNAAPVVVSVPAPVPGGLGEGPGEGLGSTQCNGVTTAAIHMELVLWQPTSGNILEGAL